MFGGPARAAVGIVLVGTALSGCANSDELKSRINGRWGPEPAISASYVDAAAQNQALVLSYLAQNVDATSQGGARTPPTAADYWYEVAQWGFNVGRQDCEIYLDNLFRMSREKARNDNVLAAAATAAAAIITGTTHAQKPLSIVAAAFGLSVALNDAIFQSYLFTQAPGLVAKKVSDLQEDFRSKITKDKVNSASSAYNAIQSYYHICLPHAIEGVMLQKIADSNPVVPGATPQLAAAPPARRLLRAPAPSSAIRTPELQ
jgi:hypothetical protein